MCICKTIPTSVYQTSLAPLKSPSRPCQSVTSHFSSFCSNGSHYSFVFTCSSTYKCMNSSVFASFCSIQCLWNICMSMQAAVVSSSSSFFFNYYEYHSIFVSIEWIPSLLSILPLMDIWLVSIWAPLWINLLWTYLWILKDFNRWLKKETMSSGTVEDFEIWFIC